MRNRRKSLSIQNLEKEKRNKIGDNAQYVWTLEQIVI